MGENKEDDIKLHVEKASGMSPEFYEAIELAAAKFRDLRNQVMHAVEASATATGIASIPEYPSFHNDLTQRLDEIKEDTGSLRELADKIEAKEAQERTPENRIKSGLMWLISNGLAWLLGYLMGKFLP